jgi:hypothetical protein
MWTYKKVNCGGGCAAGDMTDPYTIKEPANYAKMSAYLAGGAQPSQADATTIMMALAANAATSQCTYNSSYVKAVFGK